MDTGELIRRKMHEHNLTLKDVATRCGVSISAVSQWCSGTISNMRIDKVIPLCHVLHIQINELLHSIDSEQNTLDEDCLLANYRSLNDDGQKRLLEYSEMLYPMFMRKKVSD